MKNEQLNTRASGSNGGVPWVTSARMLLLGLVFILVTSLILTFSLSPADEIQQLRVGDVAPRAVLAPKRITYVSEVSTEAAQARAEAAVTAIYDLPDARIARQQIALAHQILDYFDSVRADSFASMEEKREMVAAVNDLVLTDDIITGILTTNAETWTTIKSETISALDQAMRAEIRTDQIASARRRLPTLLNLNVSDEAAVVVVAIVEDLIQPNTFVDEERTSEERQLARESVQPVTVTIEKNESILRAGDVVKAENIEALEALGLQQPASTAPDVAATFAYTTIIVLMIGAYIWYFRPQLLKQSRFQWLLFCLLMLFVIMIRLMIPAHTLLPYLFPMAALSVTLAALVDPSFGIFVTLAMGLIIGRVAGGSLELSVYAILGGLAGVFGLGRVERVSRLLLTGAYIALTNVVVVLIFRAPSTDIDSIGLLQLVAAGIANGALSASLTLIIYLAVGILFGITTSLQLTDLARPTQPLLRQMLLRAPGSHHHSLMVSNLAEQAAEGIGANTLLARVGAYYHDIGKMVRPYFFVENQMQGDNVQDRLDPYVSAQIIINHVKDGMDLAKKYHLPKDVRAFITEHQGTGLIKYFYHKALEEAEDDSEVDPDDFRYPGPKPQSKETAIVMLADSCEAAVRAANPQSVEEIDKIVRAIMLDKITSGELDECDLTLQDLEQIRAIFTQMLQGVFHPRIKYPEAIKDKIAIPAPEGARPDRSLPDPSTSVPVVVSSEKETN